MSTRKIKLTQKKTDELMADLKAAAGTGGEHLSDDDFVGYSMQTLTPAEVARVDEHLTSCAECTRGIERMVAASQAWRGREGEQRLEALRRRILLERFKKALAEALENWRALVSLPDQELWNSLFGYEVRRDWRSLLGREGLWRPAQVTASDDEGRRKIWKWRSPDGLLMGHAVLVEEGDLIFRFASDELELAGTPLAIRVGREYYLAKLERVSRKQVGAEIIIPADQVPADATEIAIEWSASQ